MWIDIALLSFIVSAFFVVALNFLDRYEKEPPSLLLFAFLSGMTATFIVVLLKRWLIADFFLSPQARSPFFRSFLEAAFLEEIVKFSLLVGIFYRKRHFSEPLDGLIYGAFIGAGFAYVENITYTARVALPAYMEAGPGAYTRALLWMTAVRSIPGHILFNSVGGYFVGMAKFTWDKDLKKEYLLKGFLSTVLLHGLFNILLMKGLSKVFFFIFLPLALLWAGFLVLRAWRLSPYRPGALEVLDLPEDWIGDEEGEKKAAWAYLVFFAFPVIAYALFLLFLIGLI